MNVALNLPPANGHRRMRQRWELIGVLYLQARIGWIVVGLFWLTLFALMLAIATKATSDPAKDAASTFMLTYLSTIAPAMSGTLLGTGTSHPALLSLWRLLPGALPLARSSVLLAGCGLWGLAALGGALLALLAGSFAPLIDALGGASAGLGIGFVVMQGSNHRAAWWSKVLTISTIIGIAIMSGTGVMKPNWANAWPAFPYLLIPVWPVAVWFAYRPDLAAAAPTPQLVRIRQRFYDRLLPGPPLPRNNTDSRLLTSSRRLNAALEFAVLVASCIFWAWLSRDYSFLGVIPVLAVFLSSMHQPSGAQLLSSRLLSLPGGLVRARMADTLFRLDGQRRFFVNAAYGMIWIACLWLFRPMTMADAMMLMASAASIAILYRAWNIAILPLVRSATTLNALCMLLTVLTIGSAVIVVDTVGWHEQLDVAAGAIWALALFALAYAMAWSLVRSSRGRWARYDLQHLAKLSAESPRAQRYWNSYLNKDRS